MYVLLMHSFISRHTIATYKMNVGVNLTCVSELSEVQLTYSLLCHLFSFVNHQINQVKAMACC